MTKKTIINKIILNYRDLDRLNDGTKWLTDILEFVNNNSLETIKKDKEKVLDRLELHN